MWHILLGGALATTISVVFPQRQAMIPYGKYGGPCCGGADCAGAWAGCQGGLPGVQAVYRQEAARADGVVRLGTMLDYTEQLVDEHPAWMAVNDELWGRAGTQAVLAPPDMFNAAFAATFNASRYLATDAARLLRPVATNLDDSESILRGAVPPYQIAEARGVRIAVLSWYPRDFWGRSLQVNPYVAKLVQTLRRLGVDCVVALGSYEAREDTEYFEAVRASGVDVVTWFRKGGVGQGGAQAVSVEKAQIALPDGSPHTVWTCQYRMLKSGVYAVSLDFAAARTAAGRLPLRSATLRVRDAEIPAAARDAAYHADELFIERLLNESSADVKLGRSAAPMPHGFIKPGASALPGDWHVACRHNDCHLGAWTADALRRVRDGTDFALVNGGMLRRGWGAGDVTKSTLKSAIPYKNQLCYLNVTAAALFAALEHSVAVVTAGGLWNRTASKTGRFLHASGLRMRVNPSLTPGRRVTAVEVPGKGEWAPVDPYRVYRLVTTEFTCKGGDGFAFPDAGREVTTVNVWSVLSASLSNDGPLVPYVNGAVAYAFDAPPLSAPFSRACTDFETVAARFQACAPCPEGQWAPSNATCEPAPRAPGFPAWAFGVVAAAVVGLGAAAGWKLTAQQRRFAKLYNDKQVATDCAVAIASMRLEECDHLYELRKPNAIQQAFIGIVDNLREYRAYMPASVLVDASGGDDDDSACWSAAPSTITVSSASRASKATTHTMQTVVEGHRAAKALMSVGLVRKRVSYCFVNAVGWLGQIEATPLDEIAKDYAALAAQVFAAFQQHKGTTDVFSGDRFACSYNAVRPAAGHCANAADTALQLQTCVQGHTLSMSVVTGAARVGNLGTDAARKFMAVSALVPWGAALERRAKRLGGAVLTDDRAAAQLVPVYQARYVDVVLCPKYCAQHVLVAELLRKALACEDQRHREEWMYEVGAAALNDPYAAWNAYVGRLALGEDARFDAGGAPDEVPEALRARLAQRPFKATVFDWC